MASDFTETRPTRLAHAGVRLALAIALIPALLWIAVFGADTLTDDWCGADALMATGALIAAGVYTSAILIPCAAVLLAPLVRQRARPTQVQRKLLALCAIGIVVPWLLAAAAMITPSPPCLDPHKNRIPIS